MTDYLASDCFGGQVPFAVHMLTYFSFLAGDGSMLQPEGTVAGWWDHLFCLVKCLNSKFLQPTCGEAGGKHKYILLLDLNRLLNCTTKLIFR